MTRDFTAQDAFLGRGCDRRCQGVSGSGEDILGDHPRLKSAMEPRDGRVCTNKNCGNIRTLGSERHFLGRVYKLKFGCRGQRANFRRVAIEQPQALQAPGIELVVDVMG